MQLSASTWLRSGAACLLALTVASRASAQSELDATNTIFYESGGPLEILVMTPSVDARVDATHGLYIDAGWEADIVSGASVAVVDSPGDVDAITSATQLEDLRNVFSGGAGVSDGSSSLSAHYAYGFENDYLSHSLSMSASTEMLGRNTQFEVSYARGWDQVCDLQQPDAARPVERSRMPSSDGCFAAPDRTRRDLSLHSVQGSWTQAWTPIFNTQLVVSTQVLRGFQSNPYRAVWLGRTAAQEHHPEDRARYALGLRSRIWIKPLGGALQLLARGYRDTWSVASGTGEAAFERNFGDWVRVRVRGRYYWQTGAAFYSDDYVLRPAGQYFTGDRELSPLSSYLVGGRVEILPLAARDETGRVSQFRLVAKADGMIFDFRDFHYGNVAVPNRKAVFGTLSFELEF